MASHLTQAGNWVPLVMNSGKRHRYVEGLVCEWRVFRGSGTHLAVPAGRCTRMTADDSTAVTSRSKGSQEPVPASTFSTVRASPSAAQTCAAIRGSVRRVAKYVAPMVSFNRALDMKSPH
jgi:hypothetical protein